MAASDVGVPATAIAAAALWAFNFHGVNMALLWISGRTALLLCVFSLAALTAWLRGRRWWTAIWCLLAMLSKEEAVVLPIALIVWRWYSRDGQPLANLTHTIRKALPVIGALGAYAVLRVWSGAFGPLNAPDYYRFTFDADSVTRNALEYLDRSCTIVVLILLVTFAIVRRGPPLQAGERRAILLSTLWLILGFALTVFLPIRSSLYALFPSIGSCLAGAVLIQAFHRVAPGRVRGTLVALLVLAFALVPVYRARNERWVEPANLSSRIVDDLQSIGGSLPHRARLLAVDDAGDRLLSVFDGLFSEAVTLYVGHGATGQLVGSTVSTSADRDVVRLYLQGDSLVIEKP